MCVLQTCTYIYIIYMYIHIHTYIYMHINTHAHRSCKFTYVCMYINMHSVYTEEGTFDRIRPHILVASGLIIRLYLIA
jgi:hypothetical protein